MAKRRTLPMVYTILLAWAAMAPAQTLTTLASFHGTNGIWPTGNLIQGAGGTFYGATIYGGINDTDQCFLSCGVVFSVTHDGVLTVLHEFSATDGSAPNPPLVQTADGTLYGATAGGGNLANCYYGCGTIFKLAADGTFATLYSFSYTDAADPNAGVILAADGNLYGTTNGGGANGCGTVFKMTLTGALTVLHNFNCGTDGVAPFSTLRQGVDGNFYGVAASGGLFDEGVVFKMTPAGALTVLHNFRGKDGSWPIGQLVQMPDTNFYGVSLEGGNFDGPICGENHGCGTIFRVTPTGTLTTLYDFVCPPHSCSNGAEPYGGLVLGNGCLYGTTWYLYGTIYRLSFGRTLTTLHTFDNTDGLNPVGSLLFAADGILYGTTYNGGADGQGTVFSLSPD
jgi:uncharacterized repeat protein (TIGR03803 family)